MTKTIVKFDRKALGSELWKHYSALQTKKFVDYARDEIQRIGERIATLNGANNFDRTGNLLDSLCWGVSLNGELQDYGFFREQMADGISTLHEWSRVSWVEPYKVKNDDGSYGYKYRTNTLSGGDFMPEVHGHDLADKYVHKYGNNKSNGWKVFFAILAPYWGYWEKGFNMKHHFGDTSTFEQAPIMAEFYDEVKSDLKGVRVRFRVSVAKYTSVSLAKTMKKTIKGR